MKKDFWSGLSVVLFLIFSPFDPANAKGIALVFNGEGVCEDGCADAAAAVSQAAGLKPRFVNGRELSHRSTPAEVAQFFADVRVWVQPGGIGNVALWSMTDRMRTELKNFIRNGGGFVGFCAGAFMATEYIGRRGAPGFGIFPGHSIAYPYYAARSDLTYALATVNWNGVKRSIFLEGGPYLIIPSESEGVEIVATYSSGAVAAARTTFGEGRVFITGLHPEAPTIWTEEDNIRDPDGSDQDLAAQMVSWAAGL